MATSFGEHLINEILPPEHQGKGPLTKKNLTNILVDIAKKTPDKYPDIVTRLKHLGDELVTLEGISVGLDDIAPDKDARDKLLAPHHAAFLKAKNFAGQEAALLGAQGSMLDYTKKHPGTMGEMARSGGRGNAEQLMKIIASPAVVRDENDHIVPWFISRSYAEGLKPSDAWVAGNEARLNDIRSHASITEPGDLSKILMNNMNDQLILEPDCGTKNGIVLKTDENHIVDRYLAHPAGTLSAGHLITPQSLEMLRKAGPTVVVRSPMTCEAAHGLCQKCRGLSPSGQIYPIGTNVGVISSQSLAEPLTQLALSAKHGGMLAKSSDDDKKLVGLKGVRQLLEIPESFLHKATLAEHDGSVTKIEKAPQGGQYVFVNDTKHYIDPSLKLKVGVGTKVEAGDMLSNGVPKPDEIVHHKGLGEGRRYLVDALHSVYADKGIDLDKRHFETLARTVLNNVYVTDTGDEDSGLLRGDTINYNRFLAAIGNSRRDVPLSESIGETLADNTLHFTAGTRITPTVQGVLSRQNYKSVSVADQAPTVEPVMRPASRSPLLGSDWMRRLGHRYLKESLLAGAHRGDVSDLHGTSAIPAYAAGTTFGQGPKGRY